MGQHVVVEVDAPRAVKDEVNEDLGILRADEEIQVVGPAGPAEDARGDAAHEQIRQAALVSDVQPVGHHLRKTCSS
jgi:hypothetical protein